MLHAFDKIAPFYDFIARFVFGDQVHESQMAFLSVIPKGSRVLLIGGGTAKWLSDFIESKEGQLDLDYVDASLTMLTIAKETLVNKYAGNVSFIHGTEADLTGEYDFIICPYIFDLFDEPSLNTFVDKLTRHLKREGELLLSDFRKNGTLWAKFLFFLMLVFFKPWLGLSVNRLLDYNKLLLKKGFAKVEQKLFYGGFIFAARYSKK